MRRSMSWLLTGVLSLVIVGFARPVAAQDTPKVEVAGGWNYFAARSNADESWEHFYKGGFGEVAVNLNSKWGALGNIAYDQKTITDTGGDVKIKVIPYLFGVRYSSRTSSKNTPFLQFLVGATKLDASQGSFSTDETNFTWQAGGGVNIKAAEHLSARIGGDYFRIMGKDDGDLTGGEAIQGLRLTAGVVIPFGGN